MFFRTPFLGQNRLYSGAALSAFCFSSGSSRLCLHSVGNSHFSFGQIATLDEQKVAAIVFAVGVRVTGPSALVARL